MQNPLRGVLLAGGTGARLHPLNLACNKHFLPVYDKPLLYYALSTLIGLGVQRVLVISSPRDLPRTRRMLRDGSQWGLRIHYAIQPRPGGIAEALLIAESFIRARAFLLMLGDNLFAPQGEAIMTAALSRALRVGAAQIFASEVNEPEKFGVLAFDREGRPVDIIEKPSAPPSRWAVTGLYLLPGDAPSVARRMARSQRNELEITDVNRAYLHRSMMKVEFLTAGETWYDVGEADSLAAASLFVQKAETANNAKIGSPELAALRAGLISPHEFDALMEQIPNGHYRYTVSRAKPPGDDRRG